MVLGTIKGDNILTAICVGKEAGLVERNQKLLVASIDPNVSSTTTALVWSEINSIDEKGGCVYNTHFRNFNL